MKLLTTMLATMTLFASVSMEAQTPQPSTSQQSTARPSGPVQQRIAPGLAALTDEVLFGDVWRRPELSPHSPRWVTTTSSLRTCVARSRPV